MYYLPFDRLMGLWIIDEFLKLIFNISQWGEFVHIIWMLEQWWKNDDDDDDDDADDDDDESHHMSNDV